MIVKVITRHGPSNYGSLLQSLATVRAVESLGYSCEIIDYQRHDERGLGAILTALSAKPQWKNNPLKKAMYIALRWPIEQLAQIRFDTFRSKLLPLTPRVSDFDGLKKLKADVFITGSDQVWGPIGRDSFDGAYFLEFVNYGRRVSYAGSFGRTNFDGQTMFSYGRLLNQYDHISVRESSAVEIIKKMGIEEPPQVLDPTLLLNSDQWSEYIGEGDTVPEGKYILVYQIHNNPQLSEYALRLSRELGIPLYRMSAYLHQRNRGGKFIAIPTPGKFLALIKNAAMLVTDSFHGTAFAINFNTPFVEILPNNGTGTRNQSILQLTGLSDRIVRDMEDFDTPRRAIDFKAVNAVIAREREASMHTLDYMLTH